MDAKEQRKAAEAFARDWQNRGDEKSDTQTFWLELLARVFGVENPARHIEFERRIQLGHKSFIDGYIPDTKVLIEQKSADHDLNKPGKQSDGSLLTPFEQANRYAKEMPYKDRPRWIIVCNFKEFHIHDMDKPQDEPEIVTLDNLPRDCVCLSMLTTELDHAIQKEKELSIDAGRLVGKLYDALLRQYGDAPDADTLAQLNKLCVRLVFCLYAEDAGLFGARNAFYDYLAAFRPLGSAQLRKALKDLFKILNTPPDERDPFDDSPVNAFPYVNGGLFSDDDPLIPPFTDEITKILLDEASLGFDWSGISPTIFGAVFESTLNPETRRRGGMHYTSIENIHKIIDPLFLDDLKADLRRIRRLKDFRTLQRRVMEFQDKLAGLRILDPACGSGNFLTESYISLRQLENEALRCLSGTESSYQTLLVDPIRVRISQFYGIEINDFAVTVAQTALWIAESQQLQKTEVIIGKPLEFFPLRTQAIIVEGNALRMNWADLVPYADLSFIIGNPPFIGYSLQNGAQKEDILSLYRDENGKPYHRAGKIDYVAGWFFKAGAACAEAEQLRCAFVATNSVTQGEQVGLVWPPLFDRFDIHFDFAYRTFRWDSEATDMAHVHCVIIGFSKTGQKPLLFDRDPVLLNAKVSTAHNINAYLTDAPNVFISARNTPLCPVPQMVRGSQPTDDGNLILTEEEKDDLLAAEPQAAPFIRPFMMGKDFIERRPRYCLWLVDADPSLLRQCPLVRARIAGVRVFRLASKKAATQKKAATPALFDEIKVSGTNYIAMPKVSSENRKYIPIDYLPSEVIAGDKLFMVAEAGVFHFGVMTSSVHMAWMRAVAGRLEMRYSYSNTVVYNNFVWPDPSEAQKDRIEKTARAILDVRTKYPNSSFADLYDPDLMPAELLKAHQANDNAVMAAYGFKNSLAEGEIVAELMRLYQAQISSYAAAD